MISEKKMYEFCKDHYYCDADDETGERPLWQPFEYYDKEEIETYIQNDVDALKLFLKHNLNKEWDEQGN